MQAQTATFAVNTGARDGELCQLQWKWERRVATPESARGWSSVFVLPGEVVKNGEPRVLILNDAAQDIVESVRGRHRRFVFVSNRHQQPFSRLYAAGWRGARRRAANRYPEWFGTEAPRGFRRVRVHDLRPPYLRPPPPGGRGHPRGPAGPAGPQGTGDHDALQRRRDRSPGGGGEPDSWGITRNFHAERKAGDRGVGVSGAKWLKADGGKGGTRTLDPGIMSAVPRRASPFVAQLLSPNSLIIADYSSQTSLGGSAVATPN